MYLYFDLSIGHFSICSMYWLKGILLWFLRTVFHEADLHYVDSDALLFPAAPPGA